MGKRLTFGPLLIAAVVLVCWLDQWAQGRPTPGSLRPLLLGSDTIPPGTFLVLVLGGLVCLAARELVQIMLDNGIKASKRIATLSALSGLLLASFIPVTIPAPRAAAIVGTAATGVLFISLVFYSWQRTVEGVVSAAGGTMLVFVYLGLMPGFLLAIRREESVWILLWVVMVTKNCDTGAYFTGRAIGRHKLIPWLSPGKTWEGLIGGVAFAALSGVLGLWLIQVLGGDPYGRIPPLWTGAFAGATFGLVGQAGDLVESLFKRDAGIKDAGRALPGFGGILDILDSPILAGPVAYWWLATVHGP